MASLREIRPLHVAAYIEECVDLVSAPTVKQRLAALRSLFDYLVRTGVVEHNPAHAVRGPSHDAVRGKTPILSPQEARRLLESIPETDVVGLRDRALIALMTYSFARVSAAVGMKVECQTAFKTDPRSASNIDPSSLCSRTGGEARSGQLAQRVAA